MAESLTTGLLAELLPKLLVAFPRNFGAKDPRIMAEIYHKGLCGLSGDSVRFAVDRAIQDDVYFPKVARLRELATDWSRRTNAVLAAQPEEAWGVCLICGARAEYPTITRVKKDPKNKYEPVRDETGAIVMETVQSDRSVIIHDRMRHGIVDRLESDA